MQPFIKQSLGRDIPKQYCSFLGERSMFQHTFERADHFIQREQKITVISQEHEGIASPQIAVHPGGALLLQPRNCDTAPGIFLPLSYLKLLAADPTVVIFPSDHFIFPVHRFFYILSSGIQALEDLPDQLILLGVRPMTPETDYGWIQPGALMKNNGRTRLYQVHSFIEKPSRANAKHLMGSGGLWNTMILIGKLTTLWNLGWLFLPNLMRKFRAFQVFIGSQWEQSMLERMYLDMPVCNFSKGLL
jgi:mannose-1-phosphate guanylyltransferase